MTPVPLTLPPAGWLLAGLGALLLGVSKTGLGGCGILGVALFAQILPARASTGYVLPLLICADVVAVTAFRRHAVAAHVLRLFPATAAGVVLGALALHSRLLHSDAAVRTLIGAVVTALVVFTYVRRWRQRRAGSQESAPAPGQGAAIWTGLLAGFLTMLANAAGPVMSLYLLAVGLPKMEFIGTGAWFFLALNVFKVPFGAALGLISGPSLAFDLALAPVAVGGALAGRWLVRFLNQALFEELTLAFALVSGLNMLLGPLLAHH